MKRLFLLLLSFFSLFAASAQGTFTMVFGGPADEHALAMVPCRDGGYALAGFTFSFGSGRSDVWVMKVNSQGQEMWRKILGGTDYDWANDLVETRDGNLVVAGYQRDSLTNQRNAWVFQLNRHGDLMWEHVYGGEQGDEAKALTQTSDGGFAVVGYSHSFSRGKSDVWLLRLNAVGAELWQRHYGTQEAEKGHCIVETRDEGFLIGGFQTAGPAAKADLLVARVDRKGQGLWRRVIASPGHDAIESVLETPQGNVLATGWGQQPEGGLQGLILELSPGGSVLRQRVFGGDGKDALYDLKPVPQGGFVAVGQSEGNGSANVWLLRLDADLYPVWESKTKAPKDDIGQVVVPVADGGFLIAGGTHSLGEGGSDFCLLKTDRMGRFDGSLDFETDIAAPPLVARESQGPAKPTLYLLSVGVSSYEESGMSLRFAHEDARSVAASFEKQEGALFERVESRVLVNEEASLVNIKEGLSWLERQATQNDLVVMFVSAHGALDHKGSHYLLPSDFDPHNLFATGLNIRDLTEGVSATPCKKLIFLDACHSGQSGRDFLEFGTPKAFDFNQAIEQLTNRENGITVVTSSSGQEFSYERPDWGHGAFTKALLEGLNGSADINQDLLVTLAELNFYLSERVKELTEGRQHPYMPINLFGNIPLYALPGH